MAEEDIDNFNEESLSVLDPYPLLTGKLREAFGSLPEHLVGIEEVDLLKIYTPNANDRLMRQNFWKEYFRARNAKHENGKILIKRVYGSVLSAETFINKVMNNPLRLAYMCTPPLGYVSHMSNLLDISLERFYEVLSLPLKKKNGDTDPGVLNAVVKVGSMIREAIYGQAVQRNINVNADIDEASRLKSADEIDKKIMELKSKLDQKIIEVSNEEKAITIATEDTE